MDILLTVTATDRRLTGTACRLGSDIPVAFSGSLELLACLEQLVAGETADRLLTESLTERFTTKGR